MKVVMIIVAPGPVTRAPEGIMLSCPSSRRACRLVSAAMANTTSRSSGDATSSYRPAVGKRLATSQWQGVQAVGWTEFEGSSAAPAPTFEPCHRTRRRGTGAPRKGQPPAHQACGRAPICFRGTQRYWACASTRWRARARPAGPAKPSRCQRGMTVARERVCRAA